MGNIWTDTKEFIPRDGLQVWHQHEAGVSANNLCNDYSGNNRHLTCSTTNAPVLTASLLNGQPGWVWNGTTSIPLARSGGFDVRHIFILNSHADATFSSTMFGLLGDIATNHILRGVASTDTFLALGSLSFINPVYRKSDLIFADNNQKAPMSGAHAVVEAHFNTRTTDGIQVGKITTDAGSFWKGTWFEQLIYNRVLPDIERLQIYQYFAMRYGVYQKNSAGLDVFPFQNDWGRPLGRSKRVLGALAQDGSFKARTKGSAKKAWDIGFTSRRVEEFDAADVFWNLKYPGTSFIYRDYAFSPARDTEVYLDSEIAQTAESYNDINYAFRIREK